MLSVALFIVVGLGVNFECSYTECRFAECCYAEGCHAGSQITRITLDLFNRLIALPLGQWQ
jgi:hypothetical protein